MSYYFTFDIFFLVIPIVEHFTRGILMKIFNIIIIIIEFKLKEKTIVMIRI